MQITKYLRSIYRSPAVKLAGLIAVFDQISKLVVDLTIPGGGRIGIVPGFFSLVHFRNKGAAWGMLDNQAFLLGIISLLVLVFLIYNFSRLTAGFPERYYGLATVSGGIAGNVIDRFLRGSVVDFLSFSLGELSWPAFNVADSAISVGILIFILSTFLRKEEPDSFSAN